RPSPFAPRCVELHSFAPKTPQTVENNREKPATRDGCHSLAHSRAYSFPNVVSQAVPIAVSAELQSNTSPHCHFFSSSFVTLAVSRVGTPSVSRSRSRPAS